MYTQTETTKTRNKTKKTVFFKTPEILAARITILGGENLVLPCNALQCANTTNGFLHYIFEIEFLL